MWAFGHPCPFVLCAFASFDKAFARRTKIAGILPPTRLVECEEMVASQADKHFRKTSL